MINVVTTPSDVTDVTDVTDHFQPRVLKIEK